MRIGIVAGEPSGDILGASLIQALRQCYPHAIIEGVGGHEMIAAGCQSLCAIEPLSVMGLTEVLCHLPQILTIRQQLLSHFQAHPPAVFIGIDAPDFNLGLEQRLKRQGIPTVHYNSPTVWAWRKGRLRKIAKAVDRMLTLFPFEEAFYRQQGLAASFIGHPLADQIPLQVNSDEARQQLGLSTSDKIIGLLPGSRINELKYLTKPFLETARWCLQQRSDLRFVVPFVNQQRREQFITIQREIAPELPIIYTDRQSHTVMAAADALLLASGTAALEALLYKKPMVVAYRLAPLSYWIAKRLVKIPYVSLPNILAQRQLVPEFIQDAVTAPQMGAALLAQLADTPSQQELLAEFRQIHERLRQGASQQAAAVIQAMLASKT